MNTPMSMFWNKVEKVSGQSNPVGAVIELTNRCNGSCKYCFHPDKHNREELSTEQLLTVIDKLDHSGIMFLSLTGGEPLLREDITLLLERVFSHDFFVVALFTNGSLLTRNHILLLRQHRQLLNPLRMTAFSHIESVHDQYSGIPGGLRKILDRGREMLKEGIRVKLTMPVMNFNVDTLNQSLSFFRNNGFEINISVPKLICDSNRSPELIYMSSKEFILKYLASIDRLYLEQDIENFRKSLLQETSADTLCRGLRQSIMVDTRGLLHPCVSFRNLSFGSILDDEPLSDILAKSSSYRETTQLSKKDLPCNSCKYNGFCNPCLGNWHSETGSLYKPGRGDCSYAEAFSEYYEKSVHV
jgi:radical SAM protein with 4Fe4S-binding SPASM domain